MARFAELIFNCTDNIADLDTVTLAFPTQPVTFTAFAVPQTSVLNFLIGPNSGVAAGSLKNKINAYLASIGNTNYVADEISYGNGAHVSGVKITATNYGDNYNLPAPVFNSAAGFTPVTNQPNSDPPFVQATVTACAVILDVSKGFAPYSFLWNDGSTEQNRTSLVNGSYSVTVTDSAPPTTPWGNPFEFWVNHPGLTTLNITVDKNIVVVTELQGNGVLVVPSGGTGAFTFSWSDGATANPRSNLVPGTYSVTVTDSVGCSATAQVVVPEYRFYFSRNPISLPLQAENHNSKPNLSFLCEVWLEPEYMSGFFEKIIELEQPADSNGSTVFQVQSILSRFLETKLPGFNQHGVSMAGGFKRYFLKYCEKYGTPPVPATYTQLNYNVVLNGGLSFEEHAYNTFFSNYLPEKKPFFTWEPALKQAYVDQPEFLYFMSRSFSLFKCRLQVTYADGSAQSLVFHTQTGVRPYELYCIPVGYGQRNIGAMQPEKRVKSWAVTVLNSSNVAISETRTFALATDHQPFRRYFLFQNSLGGYNTLVCTGKAELQLDPDTVFSKPMLAHNYDPVAGDTFVAGKRIKPTLTFSTGFLDRRRDKEKLAALQDFILSRHVVLIGDGRYHAGTVLDKVMKPLDEDVNQISLQISYALPAQENYTPQLYPSEIQTLPDTPPQS